MLNECHNHAKNKTEQVAPHQYMFAVFAPLRNSFIMDPDDVSNTRIKVPCQEKKHRNAFNLM
jgi:hypothetical protein